MTRNDQGAHNERVIQRVAIIVRDHKSYAPPSYKAVTGELNAYGLMTSRGNSWTSKSLLRMLQRHGIKGLHGVKSLC